MSPANPLIFSFDQPRFSGVASDASIETYALHLQEAALSYLFA